MTGWAELTLAFILGACVGSFCNVVIYRLHIGDSPWRGRSYCPHCRRELTARDLVPLVSYLALRGRCRTCRQPISIQYPLVESSLGLAYLLLVWTFGLTWSAVVGAVMAAFLMIIFVYDLRHQLILDRISLPAMAVALLGSLALGRRPLDLLLAAVVGAGLFAVQYAVSRGRWIGGGDIRLGAVLGFLLGWPLVVVALVIAYLSGAVVALGIILCRRGTLASVVPFGTFLSLAGFVTFLWGPAILQWYLHGSLYTWVVSTILRFYNPTYP